jgi:RNA polymerase sigma factor (sigma-70 family)
LSENRPKRSGEAGDDGSAGPADDGGSARQAEPRPCTSVESSGTRLAAASHDPSAWRKELAEIHRTFEADVWALLVAARVREPEKVHQDVFLDTGLYLLQKKRPDSIRDLVFGIAWNKVKLERRYDRRHPRCELDGNVLPAPGLDPAEELSRAREARDLYDALDRMPERARALICEVDLEGTAPAVIAERDKINPATLRSHLARARAKLRRLLRPNDDDPDSGE